MVRMKMGQNDLPDIWRFNPQGTELGAYFLFRQDVRPDRRPKVRMPFREVIGLECLGRLTCIDNEDAFLMLDHPGVNGKKLCPGRIEQYIYLTDESWSLPNSLFVLDCDCTGLDGVYVQHLFPSRIVKRANTVRLRSTLCWAALCYEPLSQNDSNLLSVILISQFRN